MMGMNAMTGGNLAGLPHIRQAIADIIGTPIGSRLQRRRYGSEVPALIDQPMNGVTRLRLYAATAHAIAMWEPRIVLTSVQLTRDADGAYALLLEGSADGQGVALAVPVNQGGNG